MPAFRLLAALAAALAFSGSTPAFAQVVGVVMGVKQGAALETGGSRQALQPRTRISNGDTIVTNGSGTVQIVFNDRTRLVVGPNSRFDVSDVRIQTGKTASKFAVEAVTGTFRFLSGQSDKRAYSIKTPTATMGIRGTEFDFSVVGGQATNLVTFDGQVRICARGRNCALVSGGCATVSATRRGQIEQPADRRARNLLLGSQFPFIVDQGRLDRTFRTNTRSCGRIRAVVIRDDAIPVQQAQQVEMASPPPPPPPPQEPPAPPPSAPPPPPQNDAGYPGQSGSPGQGTSNGRGHLNSNGKGHGKENPGQGRASGGTSDSGGDGTGGASNNGKGKGKGRLK